MEKREKEKYKVLGVEGKKYKGKSVETQPITRWKVIVNVCDCYTRNRNVIIKNLLIKRSKG